MPIYEYRCRDGHQFEVIQRMSEDPLTVCTECDAPVERLFHPIAVHFKGSGFYNTDYGKKGQSKPVDDSGSSAEKSKSSSDKSSGDKSSSDKSSGDKKSSSDKSSTAKAGSASGSGSSKSSSDG